MADKADEKEKENDVSLRRKVVEGEAIHTRAADLLLTHQSDFNSSKCTAQLSSILRKIICACREALFDIYSEESKKFRLTDS